MEFSPPRSSSIPRHYRQIPAHERFTVTDAAQLKLKLQALDDKLEPNVDIDTLKSACESRPFHEEIYVDGSEEFFLLVKSIPRADLIPDVYIEAYDAVQRGRIPVNYYRVSDFRKGVDPTWSEIWALLDKIDELCSTKLADAFLHQRTEVKPFPLLQLPPELRLHVYTHLLPRETHIAILHQPHRDHKPPRINLNIMRTNHRLHDEVAKYFYERRTLFMIAARDKSSPTLSDEYISRYYEIVSAMNPQTRSFFTKMEIQVGYLSSQTFTPRPCGSNCSVIVPMRQLFHLLPNLTTVVISLPWTRPQPYRPFSRLILQRSDTLEWLLLFVPRGVELLWARNGSGFDASTFQGEEESRMLRMIEERGPVVQGVSVATQLDAKNHDASRPIMSPKKG